MAPSCTYLGRVSAVATALRSQSPCVSQHIGSFPPSRRRAHHMLAHPSGSWKLSAMSVPFCSVHTISVSARISWPVLHHDITRTYLAVSGIRRPWICASRVAAASARLRKGRRFWLRLAVVAQSAEHSATQAASTYRHNEAPTEAGAPVKPVVVLELVDLDALAIVGRRRCQCHRGRTGKHARRSEARDRGYLRSAGGQLAAGAEAWAACALADGDMVG
jgi:hypothetical protein